jgi:hypothetical protein
MTASIRTTVLAAGTALATVASALVLSSLDSGPVVVHELPRVVVTGEVQRVTTQVVQLPRVVVTGQVQRAAPQVAQLPRVVVTGHRVDSATAMAQAGRIAASGV